MVTVLLEVGMYRLKTASKTRTITIHSSKFLMRSFHRSLFVAGILERLSIDTVLLPNTERPRTYRQTGSKKRGLSPLREVPFQRKMVSSPFFAERGLI